VKNPRVVGFVALKPKKLTKGSKLEIAYASNRQLPLSAIRYPLFTIRYPLFTIRYPLFAIAIFDSLTPPLRHGLKTPKSKLQNPGKFQIPNFTKLQFLL
jgi:hypothetical protein